MFAKAAITGTLQAGTTTFTAEYLVIAGGGGGAVLHSGGGGAGGYRSSVTGESSGGGASAESALSIALGTAYTITVGAGGAGVPPSYASDANKGANSVFATITSIGGGGGSLDGAEPAGTIDGGSGGGGGAGPTAPGGLGTAGQGYAGGNGSNAGGTTFHGGGGGGAAEVGGNSTTSVKAGDGGDGVESYITGFGLYRAGGGGGSSFSAAHSGGAGGLGGGGVGGGGGGPPTAGTANTGGGGGAGGGSSTSSAAGGSGVVIIRVPSEVVAEFSAGVVYNYIPLDDFNVYEITAAGVSDTVTFSQGALATIDDSLRFNDDDSAYMEQTFSAGNRQTFTWAGWLKRGTLGTAQFIFGANSGGNVDGGITFTANNEIGFNVSGNLYNKYTTALFRDPSAWYHVVIAFDSTAAQAVDRIKIYVNGKFETDYFTQNSGLPPLNMFTNYLNNANNHTIGKLSGYASNYFDGYLSDVYFIDGEALDPSRFGKQDADGVWQPIGYTGTYGTNGFHLDFADNSTAAALGTDTSGNGNNWTPSGITTDDQVTDTPSVNYCTLNPLALNLQTLSDGNLTVSGSDAAAAVCGTFGVSSGKWYWEVLSGGVREIVGIAQNGGKPSNYPGYTADQWGYGGLGGYLYNNNVANTYGTAYGAGVTVGVALDMDAGTVTFYRNNVSQGVATTGLTGVWAPIIRAGSTGTPSTAVANFGQRPLAYTPPTGFQALNSSNLPAPTITDGKEHFQPVLYTGNGISQSVRGLEFAPDMVWIKARSAAYDHQLHDTVRGTGSTLFPNLTQAQGAYNTLTAFLSNGFTVDGSTYLGTNGNGTTFVAWNWNAGGSTVTNTDGTITSQVRANTDAGISIVTYTGAASSTVGHGLNAAPDVLILKQRNVTNDWPVYHSALGTSQFLLLSGSSNSLFLSGYWGSVNSTTFGTSSNAGHANANGDIIAYCFAEVDGFSKFGSYTGNGSADGPFVYTGFRPAFVMIKRTDSTASWYVHDTKRSAYNAVDKYLVPNDASAEGTFATVDIISNGFKIRTNNANWNTTGGTYIFMAFAENPFKTARAR